MENYVETISRRRLGPFLRLWTAHKIEEIQRLPEYEGFKIGNQVLVKRGDFWQFARIDFIVKICTVCELYNEVAFLLNSVNGLLLSSSLVFVFNTKNLMKVDDFELQENSVLLYGPINNFWAFDGHDFCDVDSYSVLKNTISLKSEILKYDYDIVSPSLASGTDVSKNSREKHASKMSTFDDNEIAELKDCGVNFILSKELEPRE